ncbi:hypothetical protein PP175_28495 (plasmid) [Aneurinibacillus sp. Ricciae_BoGa-3]|uniref:hypothetical protein n=1 Tax=Aneurinibacillus sp. Ricciae_BoGa-3 TaxID=3022697 RepID=UPI00234266F4|nr:hypothetical protein [Aneurinibacillus sp. Ricciae_BoGa-3]WCK57131.1 hypothetical protein PP175_28495 [Aneurinibacillus sp. Ricciae_BoGa-3]
MYQCEICKEPFHHQDEMVFYNVNGDYSDMREIASLNPDNRAYQVCTGWMKKWMDLKAYNKNWVYDNR